MGCMATLSRQLPILRRQLGAITLRQLYASGLSREQVRVLARRGDLRRVHPGVYMAALFPPSHEQRALAALLACPPSTALAGFGAAAHLSLLKAWPAQLEFTHPGTSGAQGPAGVTLRRSRTLAGNTLVYNGIRTTTTISRRAWRSRPSRASCEKPSSSTASI
jgi:hypothetical protein